MLAGQEADRHLLDSGSSGGIGVVLGHGDGRTGEKE